MKKFNSLTTMISRSLAILTEVYWRMTSCCLVTTSVYLVDSIAATYEYNH